MNTNTPTAEPNLIEALRHLTPEQIEERIAELRAEDAALRTILRSIRARDRARKRLQPQEVQRDG